MKLEDEKRGTAERTNERTNDQMIYLVPQMRATELEMKLVDEKRRMAERTNEQTNEQTDGRTNKRSNDLPCSSDASNRVENEVGG